MTLARSIVGLGVTLGLVLGWTTSAGADAETCKFALSRGHEKYLIAVSKVKAKAAKSLLPGKNPVSPAETAAKIDRELQKARQLIQAGCSGVASPADADPLQCPNQPNFDACIDDLAAEADAIVADIENTLLPDGPLCIDNPFCGAEGLPLCNPENQCFCHGTIEGEVKCVSAFSCEGLQPCSSSSECPLDHACYVNTCCGASGVCGTTLCQPGGGGSAPSEGAKSSSSE